MDSLYIGTSAFTAAGWEHAFYPSRMKPQDYLSYYAQNFNTVEVDSTFYRTPSRSAVDAWNRKTPDGFVFCAKIPQVITHQKVLEGCDAEFNEFLGVMDVLGSKLGPLLLQFGYFNRDTFPTAKTFIARLRPFLGKLPKDRQFALEIRNKSWLVPEFLDLLREHSVALALIDHAWMPRPSEWFAERDPITAAFTYVRWLGDRKEIELQTKVWDKVIVDRSADLAQWAAALDPARLIRIPIYAYANNHYAGFGPATVKLFQEMWRARGGEAPQPLKPVPADPQIPFSF